MDREEERKSAKRNVHVPARVLTYTLIMIFINYVLAVSHVLFNMYVDPRKQVHANIASSSEFVRDICCRKFTQSSFDVLTISLSSRM